METQHNDFPAPHRVSITAFPKPSVRPVVPNSRQFVQKPDHVRFAVHWPGMVVNHSKGREDLRVDVEGRQLRGGENEVLIPREEGLKAAPELRAGGLCTGDVTAGEGLSGFDLATQRVLEGLGVLLEDRAVAGDVVPRAQSAERGFGGSEVRLGLLDDAAERFKGLAMRVDGRR